MEIRQFQPADREAVVALWNAAGLTRPWNNPALDIARKLTVQRELFLVGEVITPDAQATLVATVMAGYDGHRGWINYLAVAPDRQRQGLGREILAEAERLLLERGCPKINLQVRATNAAAVEFYRRLGYSVDDVVSMGKRLISDQ